MVDGDIYIDVDGVLFANYDGHLQLRSHVNSFLWWCTRTFMNCYWHTCWGSRFGDVLSTIYGGRIAMAFKDSKWNRGEGKHTGVNPARNFIWVEDGLCEREFQWLNAIGKHDSYIHVPSEGYPNILPEIQKQIQDKISGWEKICQICNDKSRCKALCEGMED